MGSFGPFDPSVLLKIPQQQEPSFAESYKFGITLRDLADQRRIRELELRQKQMELDQSQQDIQNYNRMAAGFSSGELTENSTLGDLVKRGGLKLGTQVYKNRQEALTAQLHQMQAVSNLATAQRTAEAAELKKRQEAEERASADIFSTIGAPVPAEAPHYEGQDPAELQAQARQVRAMGIMPEGTVAPTFAEARQRWLTAIGPDKAQAYLDKIELAKRQHGVEARAEETAAAELPGKKAKALAEQWQTAAQTVYGIDNQQAWDAWRAEQPEAIQKALPTQWNKGAVEFVIAKGIPAEKRATAARQAIPNTVTELEHRATDPNVTQAERDHATAALKLHTQDVLAGRPHVSVTVPGYGSVGSQATAQLTGEEFLKTLSPAAAAEIRAFATGRDTAPSAASRAGGAQQKRAALFQYDPTWTEERARLRRAFTTGPEGVNIGKNNTAIVHLGRLADASEALGNGTLTPANELYQYIRSTTGSPDPTNFELLKNAVAGEMAGALKGNATDIEIENMKHSIRASNSPAQMHGVVQEGMKILSDKLQTYDERYHQQNPADPTWTWVLPSAREAMGRFGVTARGQTPAAAPAAARPTHRFNPATGKAEPIR